MKYIIGLGNPGEKYKITRHNVAWLIFDGLELSDWKYDKYMNAEFTGKSIGNHIVLFIKPLTFMNKSGEIIPSILKREDFLTENVIIVYDDIDLPFGTVRVSYNRGDGGHNGVKSIVSYLGTKKIIRIRIGVSKLLGDGRLIKPNVLSNFSRDELSFIYENLVNKVGIIIESLINKGLEYTMNRYNKR